jgi:hypothetical protein
MQKQSKTTARIFVLIARTIVGLWLVLHSCAKSRRCDDEGKLLQKVESKESFQSVTSVSSIGADPAGVASVQNEYEAIGE